MKLATKIKIGAISIHHHGVLVAIKGYRNRLRELLRERLLDIRSRGYKPQSASVWSIKIDANMPRANSGIFDI
jgi:hypothetical protein